MYTTNYGKCRCGAVSALSTGLDTFCRVHALEYLNQEIKSSAATIKSYSEHISTCRKFVMELEKDGEKK